MAEIAERNRLTFSERIDRRVEFHRLQGELHLKQAKLKNFKATSATMNRCELQTLFQKLSSSLPSPLSKG